MKILLVNGSPRKNGTTRAALEVVMDILREQGMETDYMWIGNKPVQDCTACGVCRQRKDNRCSMDPDIVNVLLQKAGDADGFVFATPVHFSHPTGSLLSVLDRMFYAGAALLRGKPGCALAVTRRAGATAALQVMNMYFTYNEMPLASGSYWAMAHGRGPEDIAKDLEGLQTIRNLARNLAYLVKGLQAARDAGLEKPENEYGARTHFIR